MSKIAETMKDLAAKVKIDNEGLDLLRVNLRKDPLKSRAILRLSSEVGIDLPGDQAENVLVLLVSTFTGAGTEGN